MLEHTSVITTSFAVAIVLFFIFCCLFMIEHKRHLLLWSLAWGMLAIVYGTRLVMLSYDENSFLLIVNYVFTLSSSLFIYLGVKDFLHKAINKWCGFLFIINIILFVETQILALPEWLYFGLSSVFIGFLYWDAGLSFLRTNVLKGHIQYTLSIAFILWGSGILIAPLINLAYPDFIPSLYILIGAIGLTTALSLIIYYFQNVKEELLEGQRELEYLNRYDKLTGLFNRTYFEEVLHKLDCESNLPVSLVVGDMNGLKLSNDIFGHQKGDELIIEASKLLRKCFRKDDIVVRWGGDEFVILLFNTDYETTCRITQRIQAECNQTKSDVVPLDISLGVATKNYVSEDIHAVFKRAEKIMYNNKIEQTADRSSSLLKYIMCELQNKDYQTSEYIIRLKQSVDQIGGLLCLSDKERSDLVLVAELHDIGKITVPWEIITKKGPLDSNEWKIVQDHSEAGYHIVRSCVEFSHIADAILHHHEWWDGGGYPRGLKGDAIPLYSRIIAVASAYNTMLQDRAYKLAFTHEEALNELQRCSGTIFDPDIVSMFVDYKTDRVVI